MSVGAHPLRLPVRRLAFKRTAFSEQPDACETRSPCFLDHTALDAILLANIAHNCEIRATLE